MHMRFGLFLHHHPVTISIEPSLKEIVARLDNFFTEKVIDTRSYEDLIIEFISITNDVNYKIKNCNLNKLVEQSMVAKWHKINNKLTITKMAMDNYTLHKPDKQRRIAKLPPAHFNSSLVLTNIDFTDMIFIYLQDFEKAQASKVCVLWAMYTYAMQVQQQLYLPYFKTLLLIDQKSAPTLGDLNTFLTAHIKPQSYKLPWFFKPDQELEKVLTKLNLIQPKPPKPKTKTKKEHKSFEASELKRDFLTTKRC